MSRDGRATVRQKERSKLVVTGVDAGGHPFEERTEACDISEDGLSFYLSHPLSINSHLMVEVSSLFASRHFARAMVIRVRGDVSAKQFVAARFNE